MDIKGVEHIVNYDSPPTARVYVHRAGRTARAGQHGDVWTLVTNKENKWFWKSVIGGIQRNSKVEQVKIVRDEIPYAAWES
jgi:ATP-dependent RNA helicase DDX51/DBP6